MTVGEVILWVLIVLGFALMFKIVYDSDKKRKWFLSLKPGDKIKVWIFSQYCECTRDAEVVKSSDGKYLEAKILEDCSFCSAAKSKNKKGEETCWNKVTYFKQEDCGKI